MDNIKGLEERLRNVRAWASSQAVHALCDTAADALRTTIAERDEARARSRSQMDYSIDLQRLIEDICHGRSIRVPTTGAKHHYDMAVAFKAQAEARLEEAKAVLANTIAMIENPTFQGTAFGNGYDAVIRAVWDRGRAFLQPTGGEK